MLPEGFVFVKDVIPGVREDIRYAGYHNFVGCPVDGYFAPRAVLKEKAALALKEAAAEWDFCDKSHLARLLKEFQ